MTEPVNTPAVSQADYLKLFMQELTYQDPLQPVDNKEFMAQMAQFSALQEARSTNESLVQLLSMTSNTQGLQLLGKTVKIRNAEGEGKVIKVELPQGGLPQITVGMPNGEVPKVDLGQIIEVRD